MFESKIPRVRQLADVPDYQLVHSFKRTKFPHDGFYYCHEEVKPWCVYYACAGHYFDTLTEALQYAAKSKFITYDMVERIRINLIERGIIDEE